MSNGASIKSLEGKFWDALKIYFKKNSSPLEIGNHYFRNYCGINLGRAGFKLYFVVNTVENCMRCEIYINGKKAKKAFSLLENAKPAIEAIIGPNLTWQRDVPRGQGCRIECHRDGDIREKKNWPGYFDWFKNYGMKFYQAFAERIKSLNL